jgi:hypothetical protein
MYAYHAYLVSGIDSVERRSQEGEDRERWEERLRVFWELCEI